MQLKKYLDVGIFQIVLIVFIIVAFIIASENLKPESKVGNPLDIEDISSKADPTKFQNASIIETTWTPEIILNGVVQARAMVDITPEISGKILTVSPDFRIGSLVDKGGFLFQIDQRNYQLSLESTLAEIAAARSELQQIEAGAEIAKKDWEDVFPEKEITLLASKQPLVDAAKARFDAAVAKRKRAQIDLERTQITAPFKGRITAVTVDRGQIVSLNQSVGKMFALDSLEIKAPISEKQLADIGAELGKKVEIYSSEGNTVVGKGTIERRDPILDSRTRMSSLYIQPETSNGLMPGQFFTLKTLGETQDGAISISKRDVLGSGQVWIRNGAGVIRKSLTILGEIEDRIILSGLEPGETIVVAHTSDGSETGLTTASINPEKTGN